MDRHIPLMVETHAEEAAILWLQRDRAVDAPHYNRLFLSRLDERLEANVDGLLVAGRPGWDAARAAFDAFPEPGEMFALASLAFAAGSARGIGEVTEILSEDSEGRLMRAAISALGWLSPSDLNGLIQPLLDDQRASVRALGLAACSVHRVDPGPQLDRFIDDAPSVRSGAVKLAGQLGRVDLSSKINPSAENGYEALTGVLLGDRDGALQALAKVASRGSPDQRIAVEAAVLAMSDDEVRAWISDVSEGGEMLAVAAAGPMGRIDLVPWLIERMDDPALSKVAGESFSLITGADLEFDDLDADRDENEGPNDDPTDEAVALPDDMELPVPDRAAVTAWWEIQKGQFDTGSRYFRGEPVGANAWREGFDRGYQRQRRVAALSQALSTPEHPLVNWRARERRLVQWKARGTFT